MNINQITTYDHNGWHGVVAVKFQERFVNFQEWLSSQDLTCVVNKPSRRVVKARSDAGVFYVKIMNTPVEGGHVFRDFRKYLGWWMRPSRAVRTMKIMCDMLSSGVLCPEPVLAIRQRSSFFAQPEDVIVTKEVPYPDLHKVLQVASSKDRYDILNAALQDIFAFHHAGFIHGDFLPGNMLWDGQHICFIDHDRSYFAKSASLSHQRMRNLRQFSYQLYRLEGRMDIVIFFLEAYNQLSRQHYGREAVTDRAYIMQYVRERGRREHTVVDRDC